MSLASIYCTQDVRLRTRTGFNDSGEPTFTTVTTTGTVHRKRRILRTPQGEETESFAYVIVRPTESISSGMMVSIDGGGTWHDAIEIRHVRTVFGVLLHYEVSM